MYLKHFECQHKCLLEFSYIPTINPQKYYMAKYGNAPPLRHIDGESKKALIIQLRSAVAPILDNNLLPHFTDHSVLHSDGVTDLIDCLIDPLQSSSNRLTEDELVILYSASYLHDIGLQFENAGETKVVSELNLRLPWIDLNEDERRNLLRKFHHRISAEMVHSSIRAEDPIIGIQLGQAYQPSKIACLCEAHNLYFEDDEDYQRYLALTEDGPSVRMKLLSGLLRVADILEESRRRATRPKAKTLTLDLESQQHWWRHYYTEDVVLNQNEKTITIWFDFPPDRSESYDKIVPQLQMPWIEDELNRHAAVFNKYGVTWTLQSELRTKQYSDTQTMPDAVATAMMADLRLRHLAEDEKRRDILLGTFQESRPLIASRLARLREQKEKMSPSEYLLDLFDVSKDLWSIGSKRSAVTTVVFEFERSCNHLETEERVTMGTELLEMCLEEDLPEFAKGWCIALQESARSLDPSLPAAYDCFKVISEWFIAQCNYDQAVNAIEEARKVSPNASEIALLGAKLSEIQFLQGELHAVLGELETGQTND